MSEDSSPSEERRSYCTYCDDYGHDFETHIESGEGPMCECGHLAGDHHRSWFARTKYTPNGGQLIEECEYYGWNEFGGSMKNSEGKWVDHCLHFREAK